MKDLSTVDYFAPAEKLSQILCEKTQNTDPLFFRVLVSYYFTKVASMMRAQIKTHDRGVIPVSMYALNLAASGHGKGHSTNIVEEQVIQKFKHIFLEETFPAVSQANLEQLALLRSNRKGTDLEIEQTDVNNEFESLGTLAFSFDSGTTAAVKQMRHKLLMANAGSMNMEIDEIGSNLLGNMEVLTTFLELFDIGKVKQKLLKNTNESRRSEEIDGRTPTNMMLFGTPAKLLNGSKEEEEFYSMLETGYARRCIFGYNKAANHNSDLTAEQLYDIMTDNTSTAYIEQLSDKLALLASPNNFNKQLLMTRDVSILVLEYKLQCDKEADSYPDHEEIKKAEIAHRYFKALKLAGTYAFIDSSLYVTEDHIYNAIKLVEESGKAFLGILTRDRNYVKLANYIANVGREVTHVDLNEDLPFYKGTESNKKSMMDYAIAHGYQNNIIIKRHFLDGIEFLKGESLQKTDLEKIIVSYSTDMTTGFRSNEIPFRQLHKLVQAPNYHFVNHAIVDGYRNDSHCVSGFNMVVLDVDGGTDIKTVELLLKDYEYIIYTTKSHTPADNRFRVIMPLSHVVKLDGEDFKQFMVNIFDFVPFDVDRQTNQRSRKWRTHKGQYHYNQGEVLNALLFIPKTSKSEKRKQIVNSQQSLSNLERWFVNNTDSGNRSNQLVKYALLLVDSGLDIEAVKTNVLALNSKLSHKLSEAEILSTILVTASKAIHKKDTQ